jgi:hypothetical protein
LSTTPSTIEVKRPGDLCADHLGEVRVAGRDDRHDERSFGEQAVVRTKARDDFRPTSPRDWPL